MDFHFHAKQRKNTVDTFTDIQGLIYTLKRTMLLFKNSHFLPNNYDNVWNVRKLIQKLRYYCEIERFPSKLLGKGRAQLLISRALSYEISSCA